MTGNIFSSFSDQPIFVLRIDLWRTIHLNLLNIMRFTQPQLSRLSWSLWMPSLLSSMLTALQSSLLLTKMLNISRSNTNHWGMPPITGLNLDIEPLTAISNQFLVHWVVHPWNPCLPDLETRILCRTVSPAFHNSRWMMSVGIPLSTSTVSL